MIKFTASNWNSILSHQYQSAVATTTVLSSLQSAHIDSSYSSLQSLANLSLQNLQDQQQQYRSDIADFTDSVASVNDSAKALTSTGLFPGKYASASSIDTSKADVSTDNSKIVAAAQTLVNRYNDLNGILSTSNTVTKQGTKALASTKSLVSKMRSWDFADIGISMNKSTGELKLDEKKLSAALVSNSDNVKSLLTSGSGLGKTIERASKELASNPVNHYIKAPNTKDMLNYVSQTSSNSLFSQYNELVQGLFVNMMA